MASDGLSGFPLNQVTSLARSNESYMLCSYVIDSVSTLIIFGRFSELQRVMNLPREEAST